MRRRDLITSLSWPMRGRGQAPQKRALIAWFGSGAGGAGAERYIGFLREGLEELGYVAGRDFEFVSRFANFQVDRLPNVAAEIVALEPAVIVASAVDTALAAKKTTSTIPIVSGTLADAEHLGLVASYARPSGSVTGITPYVAGLPAKQIELAREVVANAAKVGILGNLSETKAPPQRQELEDAAKALGVAVFTSDVRSPEDVARAIGVLVNERVEVVIVLQTTMMLFQRQAIAAFMEVNLS